MPCEPTELRTEVLYALINILDSSSFSDVTFLVKGELIKAHKANLAALLIYFSNMFSVDMKENTSSEVDITHIEPKVFKARLRLLYGDLPGGK